MTNPTRSLMLLLCACVLAATPACKPTNEEQPSPDTAQNTPAQNQTPEAEPPAEPDDVADNIEQGGVERVEPVAEDDAPAPADEPAGEIAEDEPDPNPLTALPGFVPSIETQPDKPAAYKPPADDAAVMIHVTVFELLKKDAESLAPLSDFLGRQDAAALDAHEVAALMELYEALEPEGVLDLISRSRALVNAQQQASIGLMQFDVEATGMDQPEPDALTISLAPTIEHAGQDAESTLVRVDYDLPVDPPTASIRVQTDGLALNIGPRTRVAGTAVVPDTQSFYFVRRITSADTDIELLLVVRPQVMAVDFGK